MNLLEAQFPFWLGAVLCVKWGLGQRTSAGRGKEVVNVVPRRGSEFSGDAGNWPEASRRFRLEFCRSDGLCNVDLSQADLWGTLVTRDLGNPGLGRLLLERLVRVLLKHCLAAFTEGLITTG